MSRREGDDTDPVFIEEVEFVQYNPTDPSTFPSVCSTPDRVKERFGLVGGETLIFDLRGNYIGQVVNQLQRSYYHDNQEQHHSHGVVREGHGEGQEALRRRGQGRRGRDLPDA